MAFSVTAMKCARMDCVRPVLRLTVMTTIYAPSISAHKRLDVFSALRLGEIVMMVTPALKRTRAREVLARGLKSIAMTVTNAL